VSAAVDLIVFQLSEKIPWLSLAIC
jgi:hypothetical protein